jgi:hypothetical protein
MADLELKENPIVQAWIRAWNKKFPHCIHCGWPHSPAVICGWGATFGFARFGGRDVSVDSSNVAYLISFRTKERKGFHWKDDIFFERTNSAVLITRIELFNDCPHEEIWTIPLNEWTSIVQSTMRAVALEGQ